MTKREFFEMATTGTLTAEGIERMDNPDMPEAFRGMPSTLLYVGLLALALMGFASGSILM